MCLRRAAVGESADLFRLLARTGSGRAPGAQDPRGLRKTRSEETGSGPVSPTSAPTKLPGATQGRWILSGCEGIPPGFEGLRSAEEETEIRVSVSSSVQRGDNRAHCVGGPSKGSTGGSWVTRAEGGLPIVTPVLVGGTCGQHLLAWAREPARWETCFLGPL